MRKIYVFGCLFTALLISSFLHIHTDLFFNTTYPDSTQKITAGISVAPAIAAADLKTSANAPGIPVLMYHILLEGRNDSISVDPERFREHMAAIRAAGYTTITDYELADHLENDQPLPDKPILITFDDGYKSTYTEAFPVLKDLGMKATVNVIASRIFESPNTLHPEEYEKITWPEARLMKGTVTIQGHTWDSHHKKMDHHNEYKGVITGRSAYGLETESQADFETRVLEDFLLCKETIEEKMGYEAVSLAYPYGEYSADTIRLAQQAGFKMAFTVKSGLVNSATSKKFELNRITANGAFSGEQLLAAIESAH
ncbi:MAG TPA: polysaccharide deacetylase family protein [Planococcus sp. (in: firmicutes)]|nr:polysaccharide deacetylase family protein [Planococcus sp. (in: firmicutes)]